jgi:hypothetical protein
VVSVVVEKSGGASLKRAGCGGGERPLGFGERGGLGAGPLRGAAKAEA